MLKFIIILAAWTAPGILLFLYLFYVSKRAKRPSTDQALPAVRPTSSETHQQPRRHLQDRPADRRTVTRRVPAQNLGLAAAITAPAPTMAVTEAQGAPLPTD
jgi:hypothetical protein